MGVFSSKEPVSTHGGSFFELSSRTIDGEELSFECFRGKVTMITNVASK